MNVKTNVILLILLILCMAYVIFFHTDWFGREPPPADVAAVDESLTPDVGKVQRLILERPGEPGIVLVRREDEWRLLQPVDAPAIEWKVNSTVSKLTTLRYVRRHALDDREGFPRDDLTHLSAPLWTATFSDDEKSYALKVGRKLSMSTQTYVQLADDTHVYVVDADLAETLKKTANDYRETDVAKFPADKAVRVQIRAEQSCQLVKVDDKWALDRPLAARADQDKVKSLLGDISNISAEKFVKDAPTPLDLAGYGLDKPRLSVTVELVPPAPTTAPATAPAATKPAPAKGKVLTILFGKTADKKVFAKLADQPWIFQVDESKLENLQPKPIDLRDKVVLELAGREISRIEASPPGVAASTLEKVNGHWKIRKPFEGPCDDDAVEKLIANLTELKATGFVDKPAALAAYGLAPPAGKIVLHFRGSDKTITLLIGRKSQAGQTGFVRDATSRSVAVVESDDYAALVRSAAGYWTRTILELPAEAEITRVDLRRPDGNRAVRRGKEDKFELIRPVSAPADEDNVQALLDALKEIKADKIVALGKSLPARFAKAKRIRAMVTYRTTLPAPPATAPSTQPATSTAPATQPTTATAPATQPVRYKTHPAVAVVAIRQDGKTYAWKEGASPIAVGELPGKFHDKLAAEMRDRTVLKIDPAKATSVKIGLEKLSLEFVRSGEKWQYTADTFAKVDAGKIENFLTELAKTRAIRFADYSEKPDLKRFGLDKPAATLAVGTDSGEAIRLSVSKTGPAGSNDRYAASSEVPGVFVLGAGDAGKMDKKLADFRKD